MPAPLQLQCLSPGPGLIGFARFAPPAYRRLLGGGAGRALVLCAARAGAQPIALAVAELERDGSRLVSLVVDPGHRRRGVGGALLRALEGASRGTLRHGAAEHAWSPAARGLARSLGYTEPAPRGVCFGFDPRVLVRALPRLERRPRGLHLVRWGETSAAQRALLSRAQWVPGGLCPLAHEPGLVAELSFALLRGGEIAGWIIAEESSPRSLHYPALFVRPQLRRLGAGGALLRAALAAHAAHPQLAERQGQLLVLQESRGMRRLLERRFGGLESLRANYLEVHKHLHPRKES